MNYGERRWRQGSTYIVVLAGAAAFAAMHKYEQHLRDTGKPVNHSTMKASTFIISLSHSFSYLSF